MENPPCQALCGRFSTETSRKIRNLAFICSLLVVTLHTSWPDRGIGLIAGRAFLLVLGPVAVPFFFVVSGFFLAGHFGEDGWWGREVRKRIRSLAIPYLLWAVLFLLFQAFWDGFHSWTRGGGFSASVFDGLSRAKWLSALGMDLSRRPQLGVLWYVRCLMFFVLLSPIIFRFVRLVGLTGLCLTFPGVLAYATAFDLHLPGHDPNGFFIYGLSLEGLWFFSLGALLRFHPVRIPLCLRFLTFPIATAFLVVLSLGLVPDVNRSANLVVLSTPFILFALWTSIPIHRWASPLVSCAFPIYLLHTFFNYIIAWITTRLGGFISLIPGLSCVLVVICSIITALIIRRFAPRPNKILFGGRQVKQNE